MKLHWPLMLMLQLGRTLYYSDQDFKYLTARYRRPHYCCLMRVIRVLFWPERLILLLKKKDVPATMIAAHRAAIAEIYKTSTPLMLPLTGNRRQKMGSEIRCNGFLRIFCENPGSRFAGDFPRNYRLC